MPGHQTETTRRNGAKRVGGNASARCILLLAIPFAIPAVDAFAQDDPQQKPSASRGYEILRNKPFLPADFDDDVFAELWKTWPQSLKDKAEKATPAERRRMAFERYGLVEPPDGDGDGPALGYAPDGKGGWVMNCFTCHAGKVAGKTLLGLGNTSLDLQTLTEDVRTTKMRLGKQLTHMDLGSLKIPLNKTVGTTNAVVFGVALGSLRDKDMNFTLKLKRPAFVHHDVDAPPWWNVKKKSMLYCDGFSPKNARVLMQFILVPQNDRKQILEWERDFEDVLAYIESVEPPKYPWKVDAELAAKGRGVFEKNCSRCHGTYGRNSGSDRRKRDPVGDYPQKVVPLKTLGTDPVRLRAISRSHRERVRESWMTRYGNDPVNVAPKGYVAPPLDGVWASAPYLHNGSVPTLWHVLNPDQRPKVWKRTSADGYDRTKVGLPVETFDAVPKDVPDGAARRHYFDTGRFGKKAAGHRFPDALTDEEKRSVLEYLKTL